MTVLTPVNFLCTCGGGPGILAQVESLRSSKKVKARIILADANPASGNLYLPDVEASYVIPLCMEDDFIPALLRLIEKEKIEFLYSGLDEEMPVIARNRERIEAHGCRVLLPHYKALNNALDKYATHNSVSSTIRTPETIFMNANDDPFPLYARLDGKVIIKVTSSRGGRHIYIPDDEEDYHFYIQKARKLNRSRGLKFMIQEFIEGDEYNVTSLHDISGRPVYAISRRKFETRKIKSTTTAAVIEKNPDVIDQALSVVEVMGLFPGFNNVECIVSKKDNKPYFIEINGGRTAAQDMNIVASGVNVTDLMIDILNGKTMSPVPHPPDGLGILKIRKDVVAHIDDILNLEKI